MEIQTISLRKLRLKILSRKWRPFCPGRMSFFYLARYYILYLYHNILYIYHMEETNTTDSYLSID